MDNVRLAFDGIVDNSFYRRVDKTHNLDLYFGKNENGNISFQFRHNSKEIIKIKGTKLISIKQAILSDYIVLEFSLCNNRYKNLFYTFVEDLITSSYDIELEQAYVFLLNRYDSWKKMFSTTNEKVLTENQVIGLIGELLVLDRLMDKKGFEKAIKSWTGSALTHKDFSFDDTWIEVKSIQYSNNTVKISSIEQLESSNIGHLMILKFEKMSSEYNGYKLNLLFKEILKKIPVNNLREVFLEQVSIRGYIEIEEYDLFSYQLKWDKMYLINEKFPRISRATLSKAIVDVSYSLDLSFIEPYEEEMFI